MIREIDAVRQLVLDQAVGFDYILETRHFSDFTEFIVSTGGDVCRYRVYGSREGEYHVCAK